MTICSRCRREIDERNAQIEAEFRSGETLDQIGTKHCITRERVRQILKERDVPARNGGVTLRVIESARQRELQRRSRWDIRSQRIYGCTFDLANQLNDGLVFSAHGSRARSYVEQRRNSKMRGIRWEITFPDWCRVWNESGKWEERGISGYVMSRIGDNGPYKLGNVEIITQSQNVKDSYLITSAAERRKKALANSVATQTRMPRDRQAYDLYLQGKTFSEIATLLKIKRSTAWQYVNNSRRRLEMETA